MNATISARILALVDAGLPLREAFDAILGAGVYALMAGEVYETLRAPLSVVIP